MKDDSERHESKLSFSSLPFLLPSYLRLPITDLSSLSCPTFSLVTPLHIKRRMRTNNRINAKLTLPSTGQWTLERWILDHGKLFRLVFKSTNI